MQNMQKNRNTNAKYVKYGAYMIKREKDRLDGVIISTGHDVATSLSIAEEIYQDGIDLRVVSMPSMDLFLKQNPRYEAQLLPEDVKIFVIESSEPLVWNAFASKRNNIFGIDKYVISSNKDAEQQELGLTKEVIIRKIKENY